MASRPLNSNAQPFFSSCGYNFPTYVCYNYPVYAGHHLHPDPFHHQQNQTAVVELPTVPMRRRPKRKAAGASNRGATGDGGVIPFPSGADQQQNGSSAITTIMIKNIPNQFRRSDLLGVLTEHCMVENLDAVVRSDPNKSEFDFMYLPMDFTHFSNNEGGSNLGYAFVNFTSAIGAQRFYQRYHNFEWDVEKNRKICIITCAKVQGKKALIGNFRRKVFQCECDEYLPVVVAPPCDGVSRPNLIPLGRLRGTPNVPGST